MGVGATESRSSTMSFAVSSLSRALALFISFAARCEVEEQEESGRWRSSEGGSEREKGRDSREEEGENEVPLKQRSGGKRSEINLGKKKKKTQHNFRLQASHSGGASASMNASLAAREAGAGVSANAVG